MLVPFLAWAAPKPIEFRDIIEMREPGAPRISPNGQVIAYTVRQSSLDKDANQSSFWLVSPGSQPRRLLDESPIGAPVWLPDSSGLIVRLPRSGGKGFWRISASGGAPRALFEHAQPISAAWWSPDASRVLFTSAEVESEQERRQREREGVVYDETVHGIRSFTRNSWSKPKPQSLWIWHSGEGRSQRLNLDLAEVGSVRAIRWAPTGERAIIEYTPPKPESVNTTNLALLDGLSPGGALVFRRLVTDTAANRGVCWQPDGRRIFFASTGGSDRYFGAESRLRAADVATGSVAALPPDRQWYFLGGAECGEKSLFVEYENQSRSTLYRVDTQTGATKDAVPVPEHLSAFHFTPDYRWAACVRQSITTPPEIARVELATGQVKALTHLNPELDDVALAPATTRKWRNRFGHESNGFLFLPTETKTGEKPPLVMIQYHFSNKFTGQAQWMTSYPVQHLVAAGFAVLLHNYPRELGWKPGDFAGAARSQAENPLASMEAAISSLVEEGLIDPARKGIAGWSFGSWLAELAITQTNLFQAASAGEGGLNNAGQYWVTGSRGMQEYLDAFFGGPPFNPAYEKNYRKLAPGLNADKVRAPLLREYGTDVGVQSLEFYMALRRLGKPVEQVMYPGAPHVFDRPSHRRASMERNLDWFRFWLQGVEDQDPKKAEQYRRWRAMRQASG